MKGVQARLRQTTQQAPTELEISRDGKPNQADRDVPRIPLPTRSNRRLFGARHNRGAQDGRRTRLANVGRSAEQREE